MLYTKTHRQSTLIKCSGTNILKNFTLSASNASRTSLVCFKLARTSSTPVTQAAWIWGVTEMNTKKTCLNIWIYFHIFPDRRLKKPFLLLIKIHISTFCSKRPYQSDFHKTLPVWRTLFCIRMKTHQCIICHHKIPQK